MVRRKALLGRFLNFKNLLLHLDFWSGLFLQSAQLFSWSSPLHPDGAKRTCLYMCDSPQLYLFLNDIFSYCLFYFVLKKIMICSLFGGLSVSTTSGLGASIVTSIQGNNQFTYYFFWVVCFSLYSILVYNGFNSLPFRQMNSSSVCHLSCY